MSPQGAAARRNGLGALLAADSDLWRAQPFVTPTPAWCASHPALTGHLLALDDATVRHLAADDEALRAELAPFLPQLAAIAALSAVPAAPARVLEDPGPHFDWAIPGRKRAQIEAFCAAVGQPVAGLVDGCAGKSHLGRLFAAQWGIEVRTLERDPALVDASRQLARRARQIEPQAASVDVLAAPVELLPALAGRHLVALHACGELHRVLVDAAITAGAAALDLSPCCYGRYLAPDAVLPVGAGTVPDLALGRSDLTLAVTGTATASAGEIRRREREAQWKLGFLHLLAEGGAWRYRALCAIPAAYLREDFAGFCRALAARDGIALPAAADAGAFAAAEAAGFAHWRRVERLGLLRLAYRRALEVWIVLDLAARLEAAGYAVHLACFCPSTLTPRNLLLSARRP